MIDLKIKIKKKLYIFIVSLLVSCKVLDEIDRQRTVTEPLVKIVFGQFSNNIFGMVKHLFVIIILHWEKIRH